MRFGTGLLLTTALLWSLTVATADGRWRSLAVIPSSVAAPPTEPPSSTPLPFPLSAVLLADAPAPAPASGQPAVAAATTTPALASSAYVGSGPCVTCHGAEHQQWYRSLHTKMTKPVAQATIVGNFEPGTRFADHGRSFEFGTKDGKPFMKVAFGDQPPETFTIDYTLGAKRYQGYLATLPEGRIYVLPAFWHIESRRWVDWKEITPIPDGAHDLRQIWNTNCFNCHATNLQQGYDIATKRYSTTWTEMGIGCEACHGPAREHVKLMEAWEKDPASKPTFDNTSRNRELSELLKIFSPRSSDPRRTFDTCAYCHGNKSNVFVGFGGGQRYEDFALPFSLSDDIPANDVQGEFWPDGRPNRFNRPQAVMQSGCFIAGAITCSNCHVAHGSPNDFSLKVNINQGRSGDELCTQCHTADTPVAGAAYVGAALQKHTFHDVDSVGSRCINCHMSDVNWRLLIRRRDHTFRPPVPETTAAFGVPNACTTCHDDKTPEWAAGQMDAWWGDGPRRLASARLADVMYRAGSGDTSVVPDLARYAVDRAIGPLLRASAVDHLTSMMLGRSAGGGGDQQSQTSFGYGPSATVRRALTAPPTLSPGQVDALVAAAADPEAMVRAAAVKALAATGQRDRVLLPLIARLDDPARVVRARVAEALLNFGVVDLPAPAAVALGKAQDDYADAMRAFPDVASNHASLGWLEAERGHIPEAQQALDDALRVRPLFARPLVVKGVIAARAGRFDEALDLWRKAREIEPAYPNIDQLIVEAEKRQRP